MHVQVAAVVVHLMVYQAALYSSSCTCLSLSSRFFYFILFFFLHVLMLAYRFFVLVPIYIAGGCYYNRTRKGQNGMEACPNIGLWRSIMDNAKAGCKFSYHKVQGWTSKGGDGRISYQQQP
jgi:hypothetical protein